MARKQLRKGKSKKQVKPAAEKQTAPSRYRPHPGQPHNWTLPLSILGGGKACRSCGRTQSDIRWETMKERKVKKKKAEEAKWEEMEKEFKTNIPREKDDET